MPEWLSPKRKYITNVSRHVEKRAPSHTAVTSVENVNWCSHCGKQYGNFSKNENGTATCPSSSTPRYISKQEQAPILQKPCTPMFAAVSFTIAKTWKQPECPSAGEWIKEVWCRCTMEYYSAMKRMKLFHSQHGLTWRILSSVKQVRQRKTNTL